MTTQPFAGFSARTRLVGVMGWPVEHSLSPAMHNASLRAQGIDALYVGLPVKPERLEEAVHGLPALGFIGCNVTIPHKLGVRAYIDHFTDEAKLIGAVNTIRVEEDGSLTGHNTDCHGAVVALAVDGTEVKGKRVLILGAGGAARAVAAGAALAGASDVIIANRTLARAKELCLDLSASETLQTTRFAYLPLDSSSVVHETAASVDVVVQLSSLGMKNNAGMPFDPMHLPHHCHVLESVYAPLETEFLAACRRRGLRCTDGLAMLLEQGLLSYRFWFGKDADRSAMRAALEVAVAQKTA